MNKKILVLVFFVVIIFLAVILIQTAKAPERVQDQGIVGIKVISPTAGLEVSSPIEITGIVNGNGWIGFEGQVGTVELIAGDDTFLGQAILVAKTDWMTENPINFEASLDFQAPPADTEGVLIFHNENPSGDLTNDKTFSLPVKILASETTIVKVYFSLNSESATCEHVVSVERTIPKTEAVATAAINELLKGPIDQEIGVYGTSINPDVKIQNLKIENGTAYIDFDEQLDYQMGGSCRVTAIRAQITETLKQFPTVEDVVISIDGRTEGILQP